METIGRAGRVGFGSKITAIIRFRSSTLLPFLFGVSVLEPNIRKKGYPYC